MIHVSSPNNVKEVTSKITEDLQGFFSNIQYIAYQSNTIYYFLATNHFGEDTILKIAYVDVENWDDYTFYTYDISFYSTVSLQWVSI